MNKSRLVSYITLVYADHKSCQIQLIIGDILFQVAELPLEGGTEAMCILRRDQFDTKIWDVVSLVVLFLLPLLLLTVLYIRIAKVLCASSKLLSQVSYSDAGSCHRSTSNELPSLSGEVRGCTRVTKQDTLTTVIPPINRKLSPKITECPIPLLRNDNHDPILLNNVSDSFGEKNTCYFKKLTSTRANKLVSAQTIKMEELKCNKCRKRIHQKHCNRIKHNVSETCLHNALIHENSVSSGSSSSPARLVRPNGWGTGRLYHQSRHEGEEEGKAVGIVLESNDIDNYNISLGEDHLDNYTAQNTTFTPSAGLCAELYEVDKASECDNKVCTCSDTLVNDSSELTYRNKRKQSPDNHFLRIPSSGKPDPLRRAVVMRPSPVVLKARRKVVHMLVLVVISFAVFSLPFHARKMVQYFVPQYDNTSEFSIVFTPITCLVMFAHSAVNPILYTCLSRKFRSSLKDFLTCKISRKKKNTMIPVERSRPLLARLGSDGRVSLQLH